MIVSQTKNYDSSSSVHLKHKKRETYRSYLTICYHNSEILFYNLQRTFIYIYWMFAKRLRLSKAKTPDFPTVQFSPFDISENA